MSFSLYTLHAHSDPTVWLSPTTGNVLTFNSQDEAHRYAERVDKRFYLNYTIGIGEIGLFIQGQEHTPPKYIIKTN
jgi:hypothetical protein